MTYRRQGKSRAYLHNALGQRVFKSEPQVTQAKPDADELGGDFVHWLQSSFGWLFAHNRQPALLGQSYVYGDGQLGSYNLLGEYGNGGSKSSGRVEYLWLPTETGSAQLIGLYRNHRFYAVHADHLGTPRLITDDDNKPVWQWSYSAFGDNQPTGILKATTHPKQAVTNVPQMLKATNPAITLNLRFAGQYWDEESKLSYNYFRSYQSSQGRYTQSDPIGLAGGWNTYSYVSGNPLSRIDPMGLLDSLHFDGKTLTGYDDGAVEFRVPAVSGPWGKGKLPEGVYDANTLRRRNDPAMTCADGSGWSLNLDPMFKTSRSLLRIHPDGNVPGTEGCIGPVCSEQRKVYDALKKFFDTNPGVKTIPLTVIYPK